MSAMRARVAYPAPPSPLCAQRRRSARGRRHGRHWAGGKGGGDAGSVLPVGPARRRVSGDGNLRRGSLASRGRAGGRAEGMRRGDATLSRARRNGRRGGRPLPGDACAALTLATMPVGEALEAKSRRSRLDRARRRKAWIPGGGCLQIRNGERGAGVVFRKSLVQPAPYRPYCRLCKVVPYEGRSRYSAPCPTLSRIIVMPLGPQRHKVHPPRARPYARVRAGTRRFILEGLRGGMSCAAIARVLGISPGVVYRVRDKALENMQSDIPESLTRYVERILSEPGAAAAPDGPPASAISRRADRSPLRSSPSQSPCSPCPWWAGRW